MIHKRVGIIFIWLVVVFISSVLVAPSRVTNAADKPCDTSNALWVGTFGFGASCLDDTGWHSYSKDSGGLSSDLIQTIAICSDKNIRVVGSSGVDQTADGSSWKQLEASWSSPEGIACDSKGGVWIAHYQGVSYHDGSKWTDYDAKKLGSGQSVDLVKDVAVAPDGKVWVVTSNSIASFEGDGWTVYENGKGFDKEYFFEKIAVDGKGNVWAAHGDGVLMFDGKSWTPQNSDDLQQVQALAVDGKGNIWAGTFSKGALMFDGKGWVSFNRKNSKISSDQVRALAVDAQGRVWAGTEYGLDVFDGKDWTTFLMSNSNLLDNKVYALAVAGNGPKLPAPLTKKTGSLKGQVKLGTSPAAGAVVELCTETIGFLYTGDSPCADHPFTKQTKVGDDGTFTFTDLPVGRYGITIQRPDDKKWIRITDSFSGDSKVDITEEGNTDFGSIDISKTS
jgi:ligand-binding sensor domain-containing protein